MKRHTMGRAPDYTIAALIMLGINLFCLLFAIWAHWGLPATLLFAVCANALITRWARVRRR